MGNCNVLAAAFVFALAVTAALAPASDALLDAKRDAAAKLLRQGKTADALKLYEEIVANDEKVWSDHLALAKIYDKTGETSKAVESYQVVLALIGSAPKSGTERAALSEAKKRLDSLDALSQELDRWLGDAAKSLRSLVDNAEKTKNTLALARIQKVQRGLVQAGVTGIPMLIHVDAKADWVDTELSLVPGDTIQIAAKGRWSVKASDPSRTTDPDGLVQLSLLGGFPQGMLLARIGRDGPSIPIGSLRAVQAEAPGSLFLAINDDGRSDNAGEADVYIVRK